MFIKTLKGNEWISGTEEEHRWIIELMKQVMCTSQQPPLWAYTRRGASSHSISTHSRPSGSKVRSMGNWGRGSLLWGSSCGSASRSMVKTWIADTLRIQEETGQLVLTSRAAARPQTSKNTFNDQQQSEKQLLFGSDDRRLQHVQTPGQQRGCFISRNYCFLNAFSGQQKQQPGNAHVSYFSRPGNEQSQSSYIWSLPQSNYTFWAQWCGVWGGSDVTMMAAREAIFTLCERFDWFI